MEQREPVTIAILGTLDTKGLEVEYLREKIQERGHQAMVIDAGVLGTPRTLADIDRREVAALGGVNFDDLVMRATRSSDRMQNIQVMIRGAAGTVRRLYEEGRLDGIISVGGSMGMAIGVGAMKELPVGVPKLMVGTHFYTQYLGEADLAIIQCPTDIMGLNPVTNLTLSQAAGAICGMAEEKAIVRKTRPLVAMTGLGVTTPAVMSLQKLLDGRGYDTVVFHGNSEVMDQLVERGLIDGILDFSPNELIRIFIIEETPWRKTRLEPAGCRGIPQVMVPGTLDMIVFRLAKHEIPDQYKHRKIYRHGPHITGVRTSKEDLRRLAGIVSEKLNRARGPAAVVIPMRGFSAIDREGFAFHEPEADRVFAEELKKHLKTTIDIIEMDAHVLDDDFVNKVVRVYDKIARKVLVDHAQEVYERKGP
jgi:uncharacterized protein (UPF0261 family)